MQLVLIKYFERSIYCVIESIAVFISHFLIPEHTIAKYDGIFWGKEPFQNSTSHNISHWVTIYHIGSQYIIGNTNRTQLDRLIRSSITKQSDPNVYVQVVHCFI